MTQASPADRDIRKGEGGQRRRLHRRAPRRRGHQSLLWRCWRLSVSDLRCGGQQREGEVDRLRQRAECVLRRGLEVRVMKDLTFCKLFEDVGKGYKTRYFWV